MSSFSASDAALDGFQVIRTQWRVVVGWCLFSLLAFVALVIAAVIAIGVGALAVSDRDAAGAAGSVIGGLVLGLGGAAIQWVILAALYRMELRPTGAPGLYHLRFSGEEGRLFVLWLTLAAAFTVLMTVGFLVLSWVGGINGMAAGLGTLVFLGLVIWLSIRCSLAGPANFATGRFGLADSWRLTRGHFWSLFGMILLALCLLVLIAIVIFIVTAVVQAGIGGFRTLAPVSLSDPQALAERPGAYVFGLIAELALAPVYLVICQAPFVAAYKALAAQPD
jgi:hypothetical protein